MPREKLPTGQLSCGVLVKWSIGCEIESDGYQAMSWRIEEGIRTVRGFRLLSVELNHLVPTFLMLYIATDVANGFVMAATLKNVRAGADLLDESLPIEDIVDGVCARSIKINVVTVQTLEIIGQAKVRSLLCETDEIPGFEDEVADVRVGHMVTLIRQDFPFEINTWRGGVKASNGKHGRGLDVVGEEGTDDGTEAEQRRPTFSNSAGDNGQDVDLATLLTTAGESFKQLTVPIFEGCCRSMKEHFEREITSVKTALTIQLHLQHEEFMEAMGFRNRPPSTQADPMNSGFVLHRQRQQTAEDATGDRSAATTGMGGGFESTVPGNGGGSSPLDTVGGQAENIDDVMDIAREINVDDEGGGTSSVAKVGGTSTNMDADADVEGPIPVAGDSGVTSPVGGQASDSANHVLDTVVAEEASEPPEALCKDVNPLVSSSPQKSVQTPTDTLDAPEKKGRTGDQVKRKETNVAMEDKVQGSESLASIAAETRASKRQRGPPIKYTPPGNVVKKTKIPAAAKKKRTQLAKKTKPSPAPLPAVSIPSVVPPQNITGSFMTTTQIGPLVGGFNPCVRVNAFHLARFRTLLHTPEEYNIGEGVIVSNADFVTFFEATHPQTTKTADMAVTFIRARLRRSGITAYDFLPATFVESLRTEYHNFSRVNDIGKFSFSNKFGKQGLANMKWSANVDVLYCPCQLGTHWIGLCIDIVHWCIYVLDCNPTCIPSAKLEVLLQPIIVLMPLLIRLNGEESCSATAMAGPLPLHLIELPFLCEPPGLSCVATMLGMELHASDSLKGAESITTSDLEVAAQTYAFEAFSTFMPDVLANYTVD
ncbi:unnamed protein product [Eruca vesicaria subsp. sativa]|uniref:Ubiquitin-like protease family profile domain-containing protein n=1 Tax=Eruca vesicaria subsp. sativa TaxID=29727 RepID=A0ABC8K979_ERUVS|nr:unnamed protein product [Eruca vesicaria subsp. sativa]